MEPFKEVKKLNISLGPAPSHWGKSKLESFYRQIAQSPVDYVYLGETVCQDRLSFDPDLWFSLSDMLKDAGKEVYASSSILVKDQKQYRDFEIIARRIKNIEINSPSFLGLAQDYAAVTGVFLNIYNSTAANILAKRNIKRVVLPPEMNLDSIGSFVKRCTVPTELIVHGNVPVAMSGTCQTARSFECNGNGCGRICQRYPDGIVLKAGERPLFRIDGPQTLSAAACCLVEYLEKLVQTGIDTMRILPQWEHTIRIVQIYRDVLEHRMHCADAAKELKAISTGGVCNGWFLGKAGWLYESPNKLSTRRNFHSEQPLCSEKQPCNLSPCSDVDSIDISRQNFAVTWSNDQIARELDELTEEMNRDRDFIEQMSTFKATTIVVSTTDTDREFIILLDKQGVQVRPYTGESFDVTIKASEQILWKVLSGRMDADAAFFTGKVSVCGSVVKAFHVKNRFLSILQKHVAHKLEFEDKLTVYP